VQSQLLAIPVLLEWVVLITTLAPMVFVGRFRSRPNLGIAIWFLSLLSAGLALASVAALGVVSIFNTWVSLETQPAGSQAWLGALLISFAPWLIMALAGISLAMVNLRIEPLIESARQSQPILDASMRHLTNFMGKAVFEIDLPVALAMTSKGRIVVSNNLKVLLKEAELEAVFWHETGHIALRHNELKAVARFVKLLSPGLAASKALVRELDELAEKAADGYALRRVDATTLSKARAIFI
jgi:Zn-dependent protease with chaperone function